MPKIATRRTRVSAVVKGEFGLDRNYERKVQSLTLDGTEDIGAVFKSDGTIVVAEDVAELTGPLSILVDDTIYADFTEAGTYDCAVLVGGPGGSGWAEVVRDGLKFGDTLSSSEVDTVVGLLNDQGIKVVA